MGYSAQFGGSIFTFSSEISIWHLDYCKVHNIVTGGRSEILDMEWSRRIGTLIEKTI